MTNNDEPLTETASPETDLYDRDRCIIEIAGEAVGLLVGGARGVVFHAAAPRTWPLDRRNFASRQDAANAVRQLLRAPPITGSGSPNRPKSRSHIIPNRT